MNKPKLNMIVCVAENNLIGDKVPEGNGLLWHSLEELNYYKSKTVGNVVLFGENTAKYVPINLMKKNREVIVLTLDSKLKDIMEQYKDSGKDILSFRPSCLPHFRPSRYPAQTPSCCIPQEKLPLSSPNLPPPMFFSSYWIPPYP